MKLSYIEQGKGYPVVFIHGFCQNVSIWKDFIPELANNYRAIAIDLGGFGNSYHLLPEPTTLETMADQIKELLDFLKVEQAIFICHSLGGYVSLALAEKHPSYFKGLCLFHSSAQADNDERKELRNKSIKFLKTVGLEKYIQALLESLFYKERVDELALVIKKTSKNLLDTSVEAIEKVTIAMRDRPDRTHVLRSAEFPIMFIIGNNDSTVNFDTYPSQLHLASKSSVNFLEETGHMGMLERLDETLQFVTTFCKEILGE